MKSNRFKTVVLILSVSLLTFNACSDDDNDNSVTYSEDISITDSNITGTAEGDINNTG